MKTRLLTSILIVFIFLLVGTLAYVVWPPLPNLSYLTGSGEAYDVHILRDNWGVPHVFGSSDADVAYGLAYAHAEDDFLTIQQTLVAANGKLASVYGIDAAPNDYMVHLLRIWDVVEGQYEQDLAPETIALLEAYADGLNHYAALHPDKVILKELFPLNGKDIVAGSVHKSPLFFGLDETLGELFEDERQKDVSAKSAWFDYFSDTVDLSSLAYLWDDRPLDLGSNTFSVGPARSADSATFLAVNSHQPWEGAVTWYEAHLHSEQGWDAVGGLFPGSPVIIHGHNRHLGWAFTVNYPDLSDVYVLEINPDNVNQYRYDGKWLELEVRQAPIDIRIFGDLRFTANREVLWSVYGPVIRQDHGTYALRYAGYGLVNIWEGLYKMNKATNFEDWRAGMMGGGLPNFNVGYADDEGNIYYLYNAMLPQRAEGYDWSQYLPGNTSETLWTNYLPPERLPQILNPPSGFVMNANSTPFQTTLDPWNPSPVDYSSTYGIDMQMSNRAMRLLELLSADAEITFDEFYAIKYDWTYSEDSEMARFVEVIRETDFPEGEDDLLQAQGILGAWDRQMSPASSGATLAAFTVYFLEQNGHRVGILGSPIDEPIANKEIVDAFILAVNYIKEKHGSVDIPWAQANRLRRGTVNLGLGGGRDVMHAIDGILLENGRFQGMEGDSYVMLVWWDQSGQVRSFSIHQFGSATLDRQSSHYADQSPLFAERRLKPVLLDEVDIRRDLEREYRPGEE